MVSVAVLKVDIEGPEAALTGGDCGWLEPADAVCIEWHLESDPARLAELSRRFGFTAPRRLPGAWFMARTAH